MLIEDDDFWMRSIYFIFCFICTPLQYSPSIPKNAINFIKICYASTTFSRFRCYQLYPIMRLLINPWTVLNYICKGVMRPYIIHFFHTFKHFHKLPNGLRVITMRLACRDFLILRISLSCEATSTVYFVRPYAL